MLTFCYPGYTILYYLYRTQTSSTSPLYFMWKFPEYMRNVIRDIQDYLYKHCVQICCLAITGYESWTFDLH